MLNITLNVTLDANTSAEDTSVITKVGVCILKLTAAVNSLRNKN